MINEGFEAYYATIYSTRWKRLRQALLEDAATVPFSHGLTKPYFLNYASVLAANALRLPEGASDGAPSGGDEASRDHSVATGTGAAATTILDACAAPGGKSLVLATRLNAGQRLLANELSSERRGRLARVLDEHLDAEKRACVTVSGFDAARLAGNKREHGRFAGILLDAPCSSERHVLTSEKALAQWTPARPRSLAQRQWALLSAAFLLLRPGASLVYATCALSPEENDGVVARLLAKYGDEVVPDRADFTEGEETRFGRLILPDEAAGLGPMYVASVHRTGIFVPDSKNDEYFDKNDRRNLLR